MDDFCPNFSYQQNEEDQLGFQNTSSTFESQQQPQQQYLIQENLMTNHHALVGSLDMATFLNHNFTGHGGGALHPTPFDDNNLGTKRQQNSASGNIDFDSNGDKQKKAIHKEIERQRRYQMANLYASLKSLLPLESTKERQSTSELIHAAENHIRLKQKTIAKLIAQRDNLTKWTKTETSSRLPCNNIPVDISVRSYLGGMEILISIEMRRMDEFRLSRVLELVLAEGLSVVCCVCTRINEKILHTIQTEIIFQNFNLHEIDKYIDDEVCHLEVSDDGDLKQKLFDIIINDIPNYE